jgi:Kef-type K+ transport system membrane component KefB
MGNSVNIRILVAGVAIIALASEQIGQSFARINMPLISGFLFVGVVAGPYVLDLVTAEAIEEP